MAALGRIAAALRLEEPHIPDVDFDFDLTTPFLPPTQPPRPLVDAADARRFIAAATAWLLVSRRCLSLAYCGGSGAESNCALLRRAMGGGFFAEEAGRMLAAYEGLLRR